MCLPDPLLIYGYIDGVVMNNDWIVADMLLEEWCDGGDG